MAMDSVTVYVTIIIFLSTLVRSTFGFGEALVAMPLLAMIIDMKIATPLMAMVGTSISLVILLKSWREVDLPDAKRLIVSSILGIPLGIVLLKDVYSGLIKIILAFLIISFSAYKLRKPQISRVIGRRSSYVFGFLAGVFGGAYNTSAPPVVIYGTLRRWTPHKFRATLQGYFIATGFFILLGHWISGLWTPVVFRLYFSSIPVIAIAILLGYRLNRSVSAPKFGRYIHLFLIAVAILLLVESIG